MTTPQHITHLIHLITLSQGWSTIQNQSWNLLNSLLNILLQRQDTLSVLSSLSSIASPLSNMSPPFDREALIPLIFKQTQQIETIMENLQDLLIEFGKIAEEMHNILQKSNRLVAPLPSFSSKSSSKALKSPSKKQKSQQFSSPISKHIITDSQDIHEITIAQSNLYCTQITGMYDHEFTYKKNLIDAGTLRIVSLESVRNVLGRWKSDDSVLVDEVEDKVKVWRRVKEFDSLSKYV